MLVSRNVLITLILISTLGVIAVPFGNPKFIPEAIIIELSFITLSILISRGYRKAIYACIALASIVVIGNTVSPAHVHLMTTFSKPVNALILIIGGYVLQAALILTSLATIAGIRSRSVKESRAI
jgi:hypothetical protein